MHTDTFEEDLFGNIVSCFVTPPSAFDLDRFAMQGWIRTDFLLQTPLPCAFINFPVNIYVNINISLLNVNNFALIKGELN